MVTFSFAYHGEKKLLRNVANAADRVQRFGNCTGIALDTFELVKCGNGSASAFEMLLRLL